MIKCRCICSTWKRASLHTRLSRDRKGSAIHLKKKEGKRNNTQEALTPTVSEGVRLTESLMHHPCPQPLHHPLQARSLSAPRTRLGCFLSTMWHLFSTKERNAKHQPPSTSTLLKMAKFSAKHEIIIDLDAQYVLRCWRDRGREARAGDTHARTHTNAHKCARRCIAYCACARCSFTYMI